MPVRRRAVAQGVRARGRAAARRRRAAPRGRLTARCCSSRGRSPTRCRRFGRSGCLYPALSSLPGSAGRRGWRRSPCLFAASARAARSPSDRDDQLVERTFAVARARLDACEVVVDRPARRAARARPRESRAPCPSPPRRRRERREDVLPRRHLVRAGLAADREHRRARLLRDRMPLLLRVVEVHDRPRRRVDLLAVDRERRVAAHDDVHLLVTDGSSVWSSTTSSPAFTAVYALMPNAVTPSGFRIGLHYERPEDGHAFDLVQLQDLHPYVSSVRSSSSRSRAVRRARARTTPRAARARPSPRPRDDARTTTGVPSSNARRSRSGSGDVEDERPPTSTSPSSASSGTRLPVAPNQRSLIP